MIEGGPAPCDEGVIRAGRCPCSETPARGAWVLAATILGSSLAFIEGSVVNVALPAIQDALGATAPEVQWVINANLLFLGSLILVGGSAGDRFGRRRVFALGIAIFTASSVACGLAPGISSLIAARAAQGVGGALMVPGSLAIISATFSEAERGKAIGTWAGFSALTTALGPVLGGWLVDALSWRWVFFVIVPPAIVAMAITLWRVPESRDEAQKPLDVWGAVLATSGLSALAYGLIASSDRGWTALPVLGSLAAAVILLVGFTAREARAPAPMMPLGLFRSPTFSGANLMTVALYFALNGALFFLPFNLIQVQGYSATAAGAAFLPFTILMAGLSRWAGSLADRYGARRPLIAGPVVAGAGLALLALPGIGDGSLGSYWSSYFPGIITLGAGMTLAVAPLTTVVMNSVAEGQQGIASGVNNAASRVAGLLAIAALGVVAIGTFATELERRTEVLELTPAAREELLASAASLAATEPPSSTSADLERRVNAAIDQAFVATFRRVMLISAGLAWLSALCAALLVRDREQRTRGPAAAPARRLRDE